MTKPKLPPATDYRARDIADWNVSTFLAFIAETTREKYGVEYAPGGGGSKQTRWARERGMLKREQGKLGNAVLRKFIELCWREYRTNKPAEYPFPTVCFMLSFQDRLMTQAVAEVAKAERAAQVSSVTAEELTDWL